MEDSRIHDQFLKDSREILITLKSLLVKLESDAPDKVLFQEFGLTVDRLMGAAKNLTLGLSDQHPIVRIAECTSLCKIIAYKSAEVGEGPLREMTVAFLQDATDVLQTSHDALLLQKKEVPPLDVHLLKRLAWFVENLRSKDGKSGRASDMKQTEIDDMMKKWGLS